jgi:lysophospholipase-2
VKDGVRCTKRNDDLSLRQDLQVEGLRGGVLHVKSIIEDETERLEGRSDKIILGGFSQGSATALWSLFSGAAASKGLLGGFIGIGAWMPFTREVKRAVAVEGEDKSQSLRVGKLTSTMLEILGIDPLVSVEEVKDCLRKTPIFLGHGTDASHPLPCSLPGETLC